MTIEKIIGEDNPVDIITKVLPNAKFQHCVRLIGMAPRVGCSKRQNHV